MDEACGECKFADVTVTNMVDGEEDLGEAPHLICRRFPPSMVGFDDSAGVYWPVVHTTDWCGEFVEKEEDDE